jgi:hypothetical protein
LWVGLAVLIFGAVMLLRNLDLDLDAVGMGFLGTFSWWPLFMLIPAAITLKNAYDAYQADGRQLTRSTRTQFATGIVIVIFAVMFLFNLSVGTLWPVVVIAIGLLMLLNTGTR